MPNLQPTYTATPSLRDLPHFEGNRWNPTRVGNYTRDAETGRKAAGDVIELARSSLNPCLIASFLGMISDSGMMGGTEIGAFHRIAEELIS